MMAGRTNKWESYSNGDLLALLKQKQEEIGKKVTINDLGNKNRMPSPSYLYKRFNTWSLNKILNLGNLDTGNVQKFPKHLALENLKQYYKTLGRIPTKEDFDTLNLKPFYDYYRRYFGSYEIACLEVGLIDKASPTKDERIDISIKELIEIADNLQKCPTTEEYDSLHKNGLARRNLEHNTDMKWNDICKTYIPQYKLNLDRDITEEDIKNDIEYVIDKIGKTPTYKEYLKHSVKRYSLNAFCTAIGLTYNKTLIKFGYKPVGISTTIRTEDEMLELFERLFIELKRVPYYKDLEDNKYTPTYSTYIKYFGSIENVCELLDIDYKEYYNGAGAGKVCYDKLGNICKSIAEKEITNYLIDKNISFSKETPYSDVIINNKQGNPRRFDWKLIVGKDTYYVEYFGMYSKNPRGSIGKKYAKKTKKKIKDLYKVGLIDKCIFIFPQDLKIKSLDEIFRQYINFENINKKLA